MRIECNGTIGIVSTKQKWYNYKRKGYWVGGRWVKPKKIPKYKIVPIKEPYLSGCIELRVYEKLIIGGVYVDENGKTYICISYYNLTEEISILRIVSTNLGKTYSPPKNLHLKMQSFPERF